MPSPWDAFPPVEPVSPKQTGNPWDAFPPVDDAGFTEPSMPPSDVYDTPPDFYGPPDPGLPVVEQFGPPDLPRFQPTDPIAPAAPQYDLGAFSRQEQARLDPALLQSRYAVNKTLPSMQGMTEQEILKRTGEQLLYGDAEASAQEMIGRVSNTAVDDARASFDPSIDRNLAPRTEQEAIADAQMASRQMYGTPDNWQQFYKAPAQAPAARQMGTPQEQEIYDQIRRQVLMDMGVAKDEQRYARAQENAAQEDYANTLGMRTVGQIPIAREIGAGLASAGLGVGSIPYAIKDALTGSEDSKLITQERQRLSDATMRAGQEDAAPERLRRNLMGATESLATSALGGRFGPQGAATAGGLTSAAGAVGEGQRAGLSRTQTLINALAQGGLEVGLELGAQKLGLGGIDDILGGATASTAKQGFLEFLTKTYGKEALTEIPTGELQNAAATFISEGKLAKAEGRLDRTIDTLLQTAISSGSTATFQRLAEKVGSLSRKDLESIGIKEPTSLQEREAIKARIQKQLLESQPELATADPDKTVGAEFNTPLSKRPAEQPMPAEEFDRAVREHSLKVKNQIPSDFEISDDPLSIEPDMAKAKEAFIQYGIDNYKSTREEREKAWEWLQAKERERKAAEQKPAQKEAPAQPVTSEKPAPEAIVNPQDFELTPRSEVKQAETPVQPEPPRRTAAQVQAELAAEDEARMKKLLARGYSKKAARRILDEGVQENQVLPEEAAKKLPSYKEPVGAQSESQFIGEQASKAIRESEEDLLAQRGVQRVDPKEAERELISEQIDRTPQEVEREQAKPQAPAPAPKAEAPSKAEFIEDRILKGSSQAEAERKWVSQRGGGNIQAMAAGSGVLPIGGGKKPSKPVSKYKDIIPAIQRDILGTAPQQIGKVAIPGVNGVRGYYKRYQEVVRIGGKDAGSLHVVAHEAAHHMDKVNNAVQSAPQNIKDELGKMDYDPQAARPSEGFAEFVYDYYANDGQRNPVVKDWFENEFLPKNPALKKSVSKIKNLVEGYVGQDVEQRVKADRSKTGEATDTTTLQTHARNVETKIAHLITDRLAGLEKAEFAALRQLGKSVTESKLYQLASHFSANKRVVGYDHFANGAMNIETGERIGPGMKDVYEVLGDVSDERIDSLMNHAEALRSLDHIKRGKATSMTKSDAQEIVNRFKNDQKIQDAHKLLVEHSVGNVKMAREAGLISPEEAKAIIDSEPNYVPFKRVMEFDAFEQAVGKGGAPFMEFTGSSRQLKDIQAAILDNDARAANAAQKSHLIHSIAKFSEDNEGLGWLANEVESANEPHTYRIYRHGKYRNYRVDPAVFAALEGGMSMKNPDEFLGAVSTVLRTFATVKRLGATALNASFQLVANPARDIPAGLMRTEGFAPKQALRSLLTIPRAGIDAYRQVLGKKGADDFELARALAVQMSGTGVDFESMVYDARKLQQQMQGKGYKASIKSPLQTATEVLGFMEMAPRVAEIAAMMDKLGYTAADLKSGKPLPAVVRAKIGEAGRNVTLNFPRGGTATKAVNLWAAFTNVMVQGPSQALRTSGFKGWDPRNWDGQAASKAFVRGSALLTLPTIAMWLKNKDDEEYQKMEPYEKMLFWNFKVGGQWWKIPRIDGYSMIFAGLPEMALNGLSGRDDRAAKDAIKVLEDSIPDIGSFAPDIAKPIMEINANKDFRGRPIVNSTLEDMNPEDQHDEYTTEFAKSLGAFMEWSPKKIDYAMKAYTGGGATTVGKLIEQGPTPDAFGSSRFDPRVERSKSIEDFYEDQKTAERAKNSAAKKVQLALSDYAKDGSESNKQKLREAEKLLAENEPEYKLKSEVGSLISDIRKVSTGYDKEAKKMVSRYISGLSDVALGNKPTQAYPIPVGKDVPPEVRGATIKFLASKLSTVNQKNKTTEKELEEYTKMGYTTEEAKKLDQAKVAADKKFNLDLIKKMNLPKEALSEVVGEYLKKRGYSADEKNIKTHIGLLGLD